MARPFKQGLDYFPLDTNNDNKFEILESEYGLLGFGFIIKMFQKIYSNGYYFEWNQYSSSLLKKEFGLEKEIITEIIDFCVKINIFDEKLYKEKNILTSKGIQKRYFTISKRRKELSEIIKRDFILIDLSKYGINVDNNSVNVSNNKIIENQGKSLFLKKIQKLHSNGINVNNNSVNVDNNLINVCNNKETETETETETNITTTNNINNNVCDINVDINSAEKISSMNKISVVVDPVVDFYEKNFTEVTDYTQLFIQQCRDKKVPDELIIYAMQIALEKDKKTLAYIRGTLENWEKDDITSVLEAKQATVDFKKEKNKNQVKIGQINYKNYNQRKYENLNSHFSNNKENAKEDK